MRVHLWCRNAVVPPHPHALCHCFGCLRQQREKQCVSAAVLSDSCCAAFAARLSEGHCCDCSWRFRLVTSMRVLWSHDPVHCTDRSMSASLDVHGFVFASTYHMSNIRLPHAPARPAHCFISRSRHNMFAHDFTTTLSQRLRFPRTANLTCLRREGPDSSPVDVDADFSVHGKGTRAGRLSGAVRTDNGDQNGLRDLPRRQKATPRSDAVVQKVSSPSVHVLSEGARTDVGIPRALLLEPEMVESNTAHQHIKLEDEPPSSGRRVLLGSDRAAGPPGDAKKKKKKNWRGRGGGPKKVAERGRADKAKTQKK